MALPKILAFAGSLRADSFNKRLVKIAAAGARDAGVDVTHVDLRDFPMPIFDQDLEASEGIPETSARLKKLFFEHQGLLIASPEYNSSVTAVLKNTIDWVSRPGPGEKSVAAFAGKCAAIMSASPGALGGLRGLVHLRAILGNIDVLVLPNQVAIPKAGDAFNADGTLKDAKQTEQVQNLGVRLSNLLRKIHAG
jgi:NAD(P)H-dependent FMN reductase